MEQTNLEACQKKNYFSHSWRVLILFSLLLLLVYSNTFHASFHLDDFQNIVENKNLHIESLNPIIIFEAIFENNRGIRLFYRPVSNLSIALNWYFDKTNVTGYHIVNIGIHILTAFFLYLTIINLFNTPKIKNCYKGDEHFIAILAACLWAVNPIQTQAVTYIVQRMASMAALFYILGICFYIKARICNSLRKKIILIIGVLVAYLLAVGSKENAMMLPASVLLMEIIFFQDLSDIRIRKKVIFWGIILILIIFFSSIFLFFQGRLVDSILEGYDKRTFSLSERLLTQPRVIVFYLTQIFYPIADRLSIDHDILISTSFFSPWTTLPAIFFITALIGISIWQINEHPLLTFAILFFFLNHIIESSVIPLELIFEHRNYLPSLFLFLPISAGLKRVIDYYLKERCSKIMRGTLIGFCAVLIMLLGLGTYVRNMAWADGKTLWEDTIEKAPGRARGYQNLAHSYYQKIEKYDQVLVLSEQSMYLADSTRNKAELISLANMATVYANRKKDYEKAIELYNRILSIDPEKYDIRYRLVLTMIRAGQMENVTKHIDKLISEKPDSDDYLNLKALILLNQNDPENAWNYLKQVVSIAPDDEMTLLNLGTARMLMGEYVSAERYLKRVSGPFNRNMTALFLLMENSVRSGNPQKAETYADQLLSGFTTDQILNSLDQTSQTYLQWPLSTELIVPVILERLENKSRKIQELANTDGA